MRYRHAWPGLTLLASLALLLGALVTWGDHFLSPGPTGGIRRLLQLWAASRPAQEEAPSPGPGRSTPAPHGAPSPGPLGVPSPPPGAFRDLSPRPPAAPSPVPLPVALRPEPPPLAQPRYALDLGTFVLIDEAERAEAQLNQAGFSTVRFRQQEPIRLFSVFVSLPTEGDNGDVVMVRLHQDGFAQAVMVDQGENPVIRISGGIPLRIAVRIAERLRAAGHEPRISAEAARGPQITLRHGNFTSREEAEEVGREISRLGVVYEVVQVR